MSTSLRPTQIHLCKSLPKRMAKNSILIIDRKLLKNSFVKKWSKDFQRIEVAAGEDLKSLESFSQVIVEVIKKSAHLSPQALRIVAVGGGSLGDFAGFIASLLKRGVGLIHIPSTWLAAIDSAHGGKTALNVANFKNQIGTFYPASDTYLVKDLLLSQPPELADHALSELIKIALIEGGSLWKNLVKSSAQPHDQLILSLLPPAVEAKFKVVRKDPYEQKGIRYLLNLGHTVGHFFEAHYKMSHGEAIAQGLLFSLDWSLQRQELNVKTYQQIQNLLNNLNIRPRAFQAVSSSLFEKYISQDKKVSGKGKVRFVFVRRPGTVIVRPVSIKSLISFAQKYGLLR